MRWSEWTGIIAFAAVGALGVVMTGRSEGVGNPPPIVSGSVPRTVTPPPVPADALANRSATIPQEQPLDRSRDEALLPSTNPDRPLGEETAPVPSASAAVDGTTSDATAARAPSPDAASGSTAISDGPVPAAVDVDSAAVVVGTLAETTRRAEPVPPAGSPRSLRPERGPDPRDTGSLPAARRSTGKPVSVLVHRPAPPPAPPWALPAALAPTN